jgi:hypothetical protein
MSVMGILSVFGRVALGVGGFGLAMVAVGFVVEKTRGPSNIANASTRGGPRQTNGPRGASRFMVDGDDDEDDDAGECATRQPSRCRSSV